MIKNYCFKEDILKTEMITAESDTHSHFVKKHIEALKGYVAHKQGESTSHSIDIYNTPSNILKYNKKDVNGYQAKLWNKRLENAHEPLKNSELKPPPAETFKAMNLGTSRSHETLILSMLHGHNVLNQFRYERSQVPTPLCPYCNQDEENEVQIPGNSCTNRFKIS